MAEVEGRRHERWRNGDGGRDEAWRRWAMLVATVWIQAVTGTNFDFSAYSSALKSSLGVSQEALNYLATASDLGKALGWSSGLALLHMPLHAVLMVSAAMGLAAYAVQYYCLVAAVAVPYPLVRTRRRHCHCLAACPADVRSLSRGCEAVSFICQSPSGLSDYRPAVHLDRFAWSMRKKEINNQK
jgi:hypothetical protein